MCCFKDIEQFDIHVAEEEHRVVSFEKSWFQGFYFALIDSLRVCSVILANYFCNLATYSSTHKAD